MSTPVVSRRRMMKALGATAGAVALVPWLSEEGLAAFAEIQRTGAAPALKALTSAQYAAVEKLAEAILPADERSPGAKEARVADYIDLALAEGDAALRKEWADGVLALDAESQARHGAPFTALTAAQVEDVLTEISRYEMAPAPEPAARREDTVEPSREQQPTEVSRAEKVADSALNAPAARRQRRPVEAFFVTAKQATIHGYYTSEIGIHKELRYKGNQILAEFVGCQTVDGKDCPHCGQKAQA